MPGRVLVIDDEKAIRWSLGEALRNEGYDVAEAEDGKTGIKSFRDDPADGCAPGQLGIGTRDGP